MYPTDIISGKAVRSRAHASPDGNKLHALLEAVLRAETAFVTKQFGGAGGGGGGRGAGDFQFVVQALSAVGLEFMEELRNGGGSGSDCGGAGADADGPVANPRNVQLEQKKANLQGLLRLFQKEERSWEANKAKAVTDAEKHKEAVEQAAAAGAAAAAATARVLSRTTTAGGASSSDVAQVKQTMACSVQSIAINVRVVGGWVGWWVRDRY
jgi:hypothetical protein